MFYKHHSSFDSNMIKKGNVILLQCFPLYSFLVDVNVYMPHISNIFHCHGTDFAFIAPAYSKVCYRGSTFRPFVRPSVRHSTIYVKVLTL